MDFLSFFTGGKSRSKAVASAHVAQLAEHVLGKDEVIGSIPIMGSRFEVKIKNENKIKAGE